MIAELKKTYLWDINNRRGYGNAMGRYRTATEMAFLRKHLKGERLRILDVGGGSGRFAVPLAEQGHRIMVVDISQDAIDMLPCHHNIETLCCDFLTLDVASRFDAVIAMESVQYFTGATLVDLFTKVRHLLDPGAPFVFTGLNNQSWRYLLHTLRRSKPAYNVTNPAGYVTALRQAGLSISEMQGFVWMPFPVNSNSNLVPTIAVIERRLRLNNWVSQSPWLLLAAEHGSLAHHD